VVSAQNGETPRTSHAHSGGGVALTTEHKVWYDLNGIAMDLSSGQTVGHVRAHAEATSVAMSWVPILVIWVPQWTRSEEACVEFGREVADLLRDTRPVD
jgi:hypothetical protein